MKKKKLENWFASRKADLHAEDFEPPAGAPPVPVTGWLWECNEKGEYSYCSPEVRGLLDVPADQFIGQPLAIYRLTRASAVRVKNALAAGRFPTEIPVRFIHRNGGLVEVVISIFFQDHAADGGARYFGFNQRCASDHEVLIPVTGDRRVLKEVNYSPQMGDIELASNQLLNLLEDLRISSAVINSAPASRVIRNSTMKTLEDGSHDRVIHRTLFDRVVTEHPVYYQIEIEHCLEWGVKLELNSQERSMVQRHHKRRWGPYGWLQSLVTPRSLLEHNKYWIAVWFRIIEGRSAEIVLKHHMPGSSELVFPFQEFLMNPEMLRPALESAIDRPYHTEVWLFSGLDYLIQGNKVGREEHILY